MPFCSKCGSSINDDDVYCAECGYSQRALAGALPATVYVPAKPARSPWRIAGWLVTGIAGAVLLFVVLLVMKGAVETAHEAKEPVVALSSGNSKNPEIATPIRHADPPDNREAFRSAIRAAMQRDKYLVEQLEKNIKGVQMENQGQGLNAIATLMQNYVEEAKQIDTHECPRDFAEAFYRHIAAWSDAGETIHDHPTMLDGDEAFRRGFVGGLQGNALGAVSEMKAEGETWASIVLQKRAAIERAKHEVEAIAVRYGA